MFIVSPEKKTSKAKKKSAREAIRVNGTSLYIVELLA